MALVDELVQKITIKADTKALDVVQKKEQKLIATTNTLSDSFKSAFKWIGGGLLARSIFNATIQLDSMERSFNTLAGSTAKGAEEIQFLRQEAERLGQSFPSIAQAYKGLFATGMGANMDKNIVRGVFSGVLEASAVLGTSEQETESAIIALQQMLSKGKVMTQELRLQLGNALPGAFQIAAKAMGVSTAELEKMVSKGLDAKEFLQKFGVELHKQFGGKKLEGSIHSIRAEWTRLQNALFDAKTGVFSGETGKSLAQAIKDITSALTSQTFKSMIKTISVFLSLVMKNLNLILSAVILTKVLKLATGMRTLGMSLKFLARSGSISKMTTAMLGLSKAGWMALLPFAKIAIMLVAIHDLIVALFDEDLQKRLSDFLEKHKWLQLLVPSYPVGKVVAGIANANEKMAQKADEGGLMFAVDPFTGNPTFVPKPKKELEQTEQNPSITINQYNTTNSNPDEIAEKTKQALIGGFRQLGLGGV